MLVEMFATNKIQLFLYTMSDIYKIFQTVNNEIENIYVFIGERLVGKEDIDIASLFNLEPEN